MPGVHALAAPDAAALPDAAELDGVLRELLEQVGDLMLADGCALLAPGEDGALAVRAAHGDLAGVDGGEGGWLAAPLHAGGEELGVLQVARTRGPEFDDRDASLLELLADRVALEIRQGGVLLRHTTAWALRRSLVRARLPSLPGIELAGRHLPAASADVGGDWYDVVPLYDGRVGLAVGDVVGQGREAGAFMAELRGALRAYALESDTPGEVAERLWRFVATLDPGRMATFIYAILDPADSSLRFVSAAHPAPLVVSPGGRAAVAEQIPAAPLGVGASPRGDDDVLRPPPGSTIVLYTDGLVARAGERTASGERRLISAAAEAPLEPGALCDHLLRHVAGHPRPEDDVALLAVRVAPFLGDELRLTVPARPDRLTGLRRVMGRWLAEHGAGDDEAAALTLAFHEACASAIVRAHGAAEATFDVVATRRGAIVELVVRDRGRQRPPRGEDRGRGMALMRQLVDDVAVLPQADGTSVRLLHHLRADG